MQHNEAIVLPCSSQADLKVEVLRETVLSWVDVNHQL